MDMTVDDIVVIVRAISALLAIGLALALFLALAPIDDDDDGQQPG